MELQVEFAHPAGQTLQQGGLTVSGMMPKAAALEGGGMTPKAAVRMLAKRGKVNYAKLAGWRKYVVLIIAVVAAILTPPDVVSQCMLGLPMYLLYEVATQLARFVKPSQPEEEEA